jgi:hypothetical protein
MRMLHLMANGFAATLDWVMGVFLVWTLGQMWPYELAWHHYALGAFLGILPDLDFIHRALFAKKGEGLTDHHDSLMHRPAFMLTLAAMLGYVFGGEFWAVAAPTPIFVHYLHDTRGLGGGGIGWLWPFSRKHYGISARGILVTKPREASMLWPDHNQWLEQEYLRPSNRAVTELYLASVMLAMVVARTVADWVGHVVLWAAVLTATSLWWIFAEISEREIQ